MQKHLLPQSDTFVNVIRWNRTTGARDVKEFDGVTAANDAGTFVEGAREDIRNGRGPYTQVTLEIKQVTTWEFR